MMRTYTTMPAKNLRARVRRACAVHVRGWHVHMHMVHVHVPSSHVHMHHVHGRTR